MSRLKEQLATKSDEIGTLQGKLDFTQKSLMVAEEQVKDLLKRDQDRENHLRSLQENCQKYETALRQVQWNLVFLLSFLMHH